MNKIKNWLKTYYIQIILSLLLLLLFKECRSCNTDRQYEYYKQEYISNIDSLQIVIEQEEKICDKLYDSIITLNYENRLLRETIYDIKKDKDYYRNQNVELTTVTKTLIKKDTIK